MPVKKFRIEAGESAAEARAAAETPDARPLRFDRGLWGRVRYTGTAAKIGYFLLLGTFVSWVLAVIIYLLFAAF